MALEAGHHAMKGRSLVCLRSAKPGDMCQQVAGSALMIAADMVVVDDSPLSGEHGGYQHVEGWEVEARLVTRCWSLLRGRAQICFGCDLRATRPFPYPAATANADVADAKALRDILKTWWFHSGVFSPRNQVVSKQVRPDPRQCPQLKNSHLTNEKEKVGETF